MGRSPVCPMAKQETTKNVRMFPTRHSLDEGTRRALVTLLNQRLADSFDLYSQTKHAHWNVKGADFYQLHLLFDQLAEKVEAHVDLIAERATALGGVASGTLRMAASATSLPDLPPNVNSGHDLLAALVERYAKHGANLRAAIETADESGDQATADLFTQVVRDVDESLYFLEAHVQKP